MSRPAIKCSWRFVGHFHSMGKLSFVENIPKDLTDDFAVQFKMFS